MSLTRAIIQEQKTKEKRQIVLPSNRRHQSVGSTPMSISMADVYEKEKLLQRQLEKKREDLRKLQQVHKDESNMRVELRQNVSLKRKRQIEKHRHRIVKEAIRHKAGKMAADQLLAMNETVEQYRFIDEDEEYDREKQVTPADIAAVMQEEMQEQLHPTESPKSPLQNQPGSPFKSAEMIRQSYGSARVPGQTPLLDNSSKTRSPVLQVKAGDSNKNSATRSIQRTPAAKSPVGEVVSPGVKQTIEVVSPLSEAGQKQQAEAILNDKVMAARLNLPKVSEQPTSADPEDDADPDENSHERSRTHVLQAIGPGTVSPDIQEDSVPIKIEGFQNQSLAASTYSSRKEPMGTTFRAFDSVGANDSQQSMVRNYMHAQDDMSRHKIRKGSSRIMVLADTSLRKTKMARMSNADLEDLGGGRTTDLSREVPVQKNSAMQKQFKATGGSVFKGANKTQSGTGRLAVSLSPRKTTQQRSPGGSEDRNSPDRINEQVEEDPVGEAESPYRPPNKTERQVNQLIEQLNQQQILVPLGGLPDSREGQQRLQRLIADSVSATPDNLMRHEAELILQNAQGDNDLVVALNEQLKRQKQVNFEENNQMQPSLYQSRLTDFEQYQYYQIQQKQMMEYTAALQQMQLAAQRRMQSVPRPPKNSRDDDSASKDSSHNNDSSMSRVQIVAQHLAPQAKGKHASKGRRELGQLRDTHRVAYLSASLEGIVKAVGSPGENNKQREREQEQFRLVSKQITSERLKRKAAGGSKDRSLTMGSGSPRELSIRERSYDSGERHQSNSSGERLATLHAANSNSLEGTSYGFGSKNDGKKPTKKLVFSQRHYVHLQDQQSIQMQMNALQNSRAARLGVSPGPDALASWHQGRFFGSALTTKPLLQQAVNNASAVSPAQKYMSPAHMLAPGSAYEPPVLKGILQNQEQKTTSRRVLQVRAPQPTGNKPNATAEIVNDRVSPAALREATLSRGTSMLPGGPPAATDSVQRTKGGATQSEIEAAYQQPKYAFGGLSDGFSQAELLKQAHQPPGFHAEGKFGKRESTREAKGADAAMRLTGVGSSVLGRSAVRDLPGDPEGETVRDPNADDRDSLKMSLEVNGRATFLAGTSQVHINNKAGKVSDAASRPSVLADPRLQQNATHAGPFNLMSGGGLVGDVDIAEQGSVDLVANKKARRSPNKSTERSGLSRVTSTPVGNAAALAGPPDAGSFAANLRATGGNASGEAHGDHKTQSGFFEPASVVGAPINMSSRLAVFVEKKDLSPPPRKGRRSSRSPSETDQGSPHPHLEPAGEERASPGLQNASPKGGNLIKGLSPSVRVKGRRKPARLQTSALADAASQASDLELHAETKRPEGIVPRPKEFNTSMYNISPIEVYIEKKPLGKSNSPGKRRGGHAGGALKNQKRDKTSSPSYGPRVGSIRSPQHRDSNQQVLVSHGNGFIGSIQPMSGPEVLNVSQATGRIPNVFISNPANIRQGPLAANLTQVMQARYGTNYVQKAATRNFRKTGLIGPNFTLPDGQIAVTGAGKKSSSPLSIDRKGSPGRDKSPSADSHEASRGSGALPLADAMDMLSRKGQASKLHMQPKYLSSPSSKKRNRPEPGGPAPPPPLPSLPVQNLNSSQRIYGRKSPSQASFSNASPGTRTKVALGQSPTRLSTKQPGDAPRLDKKRFQLAELPEMTAEDQLSISVYAGMRSQGVAAMGQTLSRHDEGMNRDLIGKLTPIDFDRETIDSPRKVDVARIFEAKSLRGAVNQNDVMKLLDFAKKHSQLVDTFEIIRELGVIKSKQLISSKTGEKATGKSEIEQLLLILQQDPDLIAQGLEKQKLTDLLKALSDLQKYVVSKNVLDPQTYMRQQTVKNKRNYEELWYRDRQERRTEAFLSLLKQRMQRGAEPLNSSKEDLKQQDSAEKDPREPLDDLKAIDRHLLPSYLLQTSERKAKKPNELVLKKRRALSDLEFIRGKLISDTNNLKSPTTPGGGGLDRELTRLEVLLEKQLILLNSEGLHASQMESALEEDTLAKVDDDNQIAQRLDEIMKKALHFTASVKRQKALQQNRRKRAAQLAEYEDEEARRRRFGHADTTFTKGWEAWETETVSQGERHEPSRMQPRRKADHHERASEIQRWGDPARDELDSGTIRRRFNPILTKDEVMPQNDELLQIIKERYTGVDVEYNSRWKRKYALGLEVDNLHDIYQEEFADHSELGLGSGSVAPPGSLGKGLRRDASRALTLGTVQHEAGKSFDLPHHKLLQKHQSKVSLAPSIMPGGDIATSVSVRHAIRSIHGPGSPYSGNTSRDMRIQRHLSSKSIATILTVQASEQKRKKVMQKRELREQLENAKSVADTIRMEKLREGPKNRDAAYSQVLEDTNCLLPSLYDPRIAEMITPIHEVIGGNTTRRNAILKAHWNPSLRSPQPASRNLLETIQTPQDNQNDTPADNGNILNLSNLRKLDLQQMLSSNAGMTSRGRTTALETKKYLTQQKTGVTMHTIHPNGDAFIKELEKDPERLKKFADGITGPKASDPEAALYYRKGLTYLDRLAPPLKVPQKILPRYVSPVPVKKEKEKLQFDFEKGLALTEEKDCFTGKMAPMVDKQFKIRDKLVRAVEPSAALCLRQVSHQDLLASYKRPVLNERPKAEPWDTKSLDSEGRREYRRQLNEETSRKLRKMFEHVPM